jgi:serine/threonine protein kinase
MITVQDNSVLSEETAKIYLRKILSALQHMHANNVVHRDIKPENIMLTKEGEIKIIDFGLSKKQNKEDSMMKTIAGTPYYMAPEVICERKYSSKVDLWSVGVLLYVFMCGYMPFMSDKRFDIYMKI